MRRRPPESVGNTDHPPRAPLVHAGTRPNELSRQDRCLASAMRPLDAQDSIFAGGAGAAAGRRRRARKARRAGSPSAGVAARQAGKGQGAAR